MDQDLIFMAVVGFFAAFVLFKLYTVLGRRTGAEPPPQPVTPQGLAPGGPRMAFAPGALRGAAAGDGVMAIIRADPGFDMERFMAGARVSYEQIVNAFA
ncbi:MAG TPA: hypothetical protein VHC73_11120, partial [Vitreimonas sp.]|nr:hypothetical protein [Vitreimonas sp.]